MMCYEACKRLWMLPGLMLSAWRAALWYAARDNIFIGILIAWRRQDAFHWFARLLVFVAGFPVMLWYDLQVELRLAALEKAMGSYWAVKLIFGFSTVVLTRILYFVAMLPTYAKKSCLVCGMSGSKAHLFKVILYVPCLGLIGYLTFDGVVMLLRELRGEETIRLSPGNQRTKELTVVGFIMIVVTNIAFGFLFDVAMWMGFGRMCFTPTYGKGYTTVAAVDAYFAERPLIVRQYLGDALPVVQADGQDGDKAVAHSWPDVAVGPPVQQGQPRRGDQQGQVRQQPQDDGQSSSNKATTTSVPSIIGIMSPSPVRASAGLDDTARLPLPAGVVARI